MDSVIVTICKQQALRLESWPIPTIDNVIAVLLCVDNDSCPFNDSTLPHVIVKLYTR